MSITPKQQATLSVQIAARMVSETAIAAYYTQHSHHYAELRRLAAELRPLLDALEVALKEGEDE